MRVNKREMANRIRIGLSILERQMTDREEVVDNILHYFARLHGIGVAVRETEDNKLRYEFMSFPYEVAHDCYGDQTATSKSTSMIIVRQDIDNITDIDVRRGLGLVEKKLYLHHWEEYLKEDASSYGFRSYTTIVDDLVPEKVKKHEDSLDAMTYIMSFPRNCGKTNLVTRAMEEYAKRDVEVTRNAYKHMLNSIYGISAFNNGLLDISDVIFNDPATIVLWRDGSKTVVKAQDGETYDPEKGLAMAICKKTMGNTRDYYITFKKHLKKWKKEYPEKKELGVVENNDDGKHRYITFVVLSDFAGRHDLHVNHDTTKGKFIFINAEGMSASFEADQLETVDNIDRIINAVRSFFNIPE